MLEVTGGAEVGTRLAAGNPPVPRPRPARCAPEAHVLLLAGGSGKTEALELLLCLGRLAVDMPELRNTVAKKLEG